MRALRFIFPRTIFDREVYIIVTDGDTVHDIVNRLGSEYQGDFNVDFVTPIAQLADDLAA